MNAYARLRARFARIATLNEARSVLDWDASAMMPGGGSAARGDQLAVLAGMAHELLTASGVADDLAEARDHPPAGDWDVANLRLMNHAYVRATALPVDLVEARARANSGCEKIWREARARSDFALVSDSLKEVVSLTRQSAAALGEALDLHPYDALMDGFQRGIGAADADLIFSRYERFAAIALPEAERLQDRKEAPESLDGSFSVEAQEQLCRRLAQRLGLDFAHARLDQSAHPFCGGTSTDVRITTRYNPSDPAIALLGVLHETGHALYERGLPSAHAREPVGRSAGMAVHESQSLIIEMQACRSDAFLNWLAPELKRQFGGSSERYTASNLQRLWRRVERGFIRVDADEMTYPAHIILRFRLEQALMNGALGVSDVPQAWREGMQSLLGITPPDDKSGCLQDIHWYAGLFGYFPSYTLGAMAAAQLMAEARRQILTLDAALGIGDLQPLVTWLRINVHEQGARLGLNALLQSATGSALDPAYLERHLAHRYLSVT